MNHKEGWVVIYPHIESPGYRDENDALVFYEEQREPYEDIADDVMCHLVQFKDGEREWGEIDWCEELEVRYAYQLEDGRTGICFYDDPDRIEFVHHPGGEDLIRVAHSAEIQTLMLALQRTAS